MPSATTIGPFLIETEDDDGPFRPFEVTYSHFILKRFKTFEHAQRWCITQCAIFRLEGVITREIERAPAADGNTYTVEVAWNHKTHPLNP